MRLKISHSGSVGRILRAFFWCAFFWNKKTKTREQLKVGNKII